MSKGPQRQRPAHPAWDGAETSRRIYARAFRNANRPGATAKDRATLAAAYRLVELEREVAGRAVEDALAQDEKARVLAEARLRRRARFWQVRAALDKESGPR